MDKPKRLAIGYARVSTDKQADHGVSLMAQAAKINAMAAVQDLNLIEIVTEGGESAKNMARPGLQRLLTLVDAGKVAVVIIAKLDRLTRSVRDLADLLERFEKRRVSLVSVAESLDTGSAAGRLVLNIMVSVSQWEREAIGERTAVALQHKRASKLVYTHKIPYGYNREGQRLVPVDAEQAVIRRVKAWRSQGWTLRRIADTLNQDGISTKQGSRWFAQTVKDILGNPLHHEAA
jgi:site-specific DNA recombinase